MHGPHSFGWLPAIAIFVVFSAASQAQLAMNSPQPLTAHFTTAPPPSIPGSSVLVAAPTFEDRGDAYLARKEYQAALKAYAQIQPASAGVLNKMGISYQMMFDQKDAEHCYKESLKLDPTNSRVVNNLATVEDSLEDYSGAERLYMKALKLNPRSAVVLKNLGTNLLRQHEYGRGADAYAQALAIDPHIFDPYSGPKIDAPSTAGERGTASYFEARSCARAGLDDCAIDHLRRAFNSGFATLKQVANEDDFEKLRGKPEFEGLLAEQK